MTEFTIRPVRAAELPEFIVRCTAGYERQKVELGGIPAQEAAAQASAEMEQHFPDGGLRDGHAVFYLVDAEDRRAGDLWVARRDDSSSAFICNVEVEPAFRHQGLGRRLMAHAEDWARQQGLASISLHVFGGNTGAIALYERLDYQVTDLMMRKPL